MELILLNIVDILHCINDKDDEEIIREKIKKLSNLIGHNFIEKVKIDMQKSENEKKFNEMIRKLR